MTEDPRKKQVAELLQATLDLNATDRQRYLDENCGADPELKREVLRLVELQGASSGFLEDAAEKIGNYRILGTLGEGGMGVVYLAEQKEPIRRRVALKLIKLGMDTKEVIARFEAERNALALMNHPNIARVYDAGATEDGRPYFAMEHVEGVPITDFCQRHRINVPERLELFLQVCRGVDHAHHRGVLHRDIKPSNILVGIADEKPVAKIIDFGVARATNQRLTEKTIYTEIGRAVGTPAYMSPEQADLTGEGVDHRTDVYSLGVLLYELLVGQLPLDIDVQTVAFDEMVRRIREDEPLLPSVRWSRLNPDRTTKLAAERQTRSSSVQQQLRGDLDWICMKAIEKDRERRYSSAAHIAEDITRHLKGEPASAGPPSVLYRVGKYVRRHRGLVGATVAVCLALTAGLVASVLFALDARKHATRADEKAFEAGESEKLARDRLEEVLLLSDIQRLTDLDGEARALWPALPAKVEPMREWLKKATELTERLGKHRAALSSLRENALRHDEVARARDRESHPRLEELGRWKRLRQNRLEEANRLEDAAEAPATVLSYGEDPLRKPIAVYFRRAFEAAASGAEELELQLAVDDGAIVYLNGDEAFRVNLPEGEVTHTMGAPRAVPAKEVTFSRESLPSRFLRDGRNVIAAEVHLGGHAAHGLRFELELRRGQETLVRRSAVWRYLDHDAPPHAAWKTAGYDDGEWPAGPAPLGYGFADGPGRWRELRREVDSLTEKISGLEAEIAERRTWNFATREDRWEHDSRSQLVADLEEFLDEDPATGTVASVNERLGFAETITRRSLEDHRGEWDAARASIRDPSRCPFYKGLELEPQLGVVPIGRDPASRLWEFWHVRSGERPERDEEGQLVLTEESGIVFVRIPGGTFRMGSPAYPDEKPVREVTLGPFFISRYEMTQGQWLRVSHGNPSAYGPDRDHFGYQHSLLHPVEQISWPRCRQVLEHLGLILPTEAQWEYAARAGTTTVWWTGDDETSLSGAANLADTYCKQNHGPLGLQYEEWLADGYTTHAPVGSFRANDFGLHDVVGNVLEWTRDARVSYEETPREGDGLRTSDDATLRVCRGGSWYLPAENARSAIRTPYRPDSRGSHLGVRPAREITE